jgi:hypothetical protein
LDPDFEAVNDFVQLQIATNVKDMGVTIKALYAVYVKPDKNGGQVRLEDGKIVEGSILRDLCCFMYAYFPAVGYVVVP